MFQKVNLVKIKQTGMKQVLTGLKFRNILFYQNEITASAEIP